MERIGISYGRTSKEKDDAFSVSSQHKRNREYAAQQNITLPKEYEFSEDHTGKAIDRPELNKIRRLMREHAINAVIIYAADRLARKVAVADILLDECFDHDVELHIVDWNGPVRRTASDRRRFLDESVDSQIEREKIIERTTRGKQEKLEAGLWIGATPVDKYGFRKVGKKRDMRLELVEEEIETVKFIFDALTRKRWKVFKIVEHLDATGTPTRSQAKDYTSKLKTKWDRRDVYKILRDECYTGVWYANKTYNKQRTRPKEEWVRLEFPHLRVIDDETFEEARRIINAGRNKYAPAPKYDYLMARRLRCQCGSAVISTSAQSGKYLYYKCLNTYKCKSGIQSIRADYVDQEVWDELEDFLHNPKKQYETLKAAQADLEEENREAVNYMREYEQAKERYHKSLKNYAEMLDERLITREVMREKKEELDRRLAANEVGYQEYASKVSGKVPTDADIDSTMSDLADLREALDHIDEMPFEGRKRLLDLMHVNGKMVIENGWQVLKLYAYKTRIEDLLLVECPSLFSTVSRTTPVPSGASPTPARSSATSRGTTRSCASPRTSRGCCGSGAKDRMIWRQHITPSSS